jgi:hypothetical protein
MDTTDPTFAGWLDRLARTGHRVLHSHAVPVQLWLSRPDGTVLHFLTRGTRIVLRSYAAADLVTLVLRSECDCPDHRSAGARGRLMLLPGATPLACAELDGAAEHGWRSVEATMLPVRQLAEVFDRLADEVLGAVDAVA